ncbi:GHKL domain-containing protein [Enterococcus rivorum]|nr:GHKL domain-containing protein [Enterococcus rivorum]MBP2099617.1 sensor histidine kinase YesM [Enterococcus rivorum]
MERQRIQELKENQLHDLNAYVQQVEAMYDEIRSFKHDYHNVLISLNESIKTKDLTVIEHAYKQVLIKEGIALQEEQYSLTKLNNLKTLPIKGVFSTHIINAWQKKIKVHFEVEDVIQDEPIEILDYIRITSILLDNAIEAAEITRDPFLTIVFLMNHNRKEKRIIIENSYENEQLDTRKLFQKGYSTKGGDHGTGLATVEKILKEYPHISLQTEVEPFLFRQTLIIREEIKK